MTNDVSFIKVERFESQKLQCRSKNSDLVSPESCRSIDVGRVVKENKVAGFTPEMLRDKRKTSWILLL